jgi:retinoid hydroxylase
MILKLVVGVSFGIVTYCYLKKRKIIGVPPGSWLDFFKSALPPPDPIPAEHAHFQKSELSIMYFLFVELLRVSGKEAIDFVAEQERFGNVENAWPASTSTLLGPKVLSVSTGKLHTTLRKLNATAFRPSTLNSYIPKIENVTRRIICNPLQIGNPFERTCKTIVTTIVFDCLFGVNNVMSSEFQNTLAEWNSYFIDYNAGLFSMPINLPGFAFYKAKNAREKLVQQLIPLIKKQKKIYNESGNDEEYKTALIALMETPMDDGSFLTEYEMGEQALLLYFAGHDTTASFLTNIIKLLHDHPHVLAKARQEQLRLFPQNQHITSQDLSQMVYLEACIKETLRFRAIVARVFKKAEQDLVYKNILIPKGTLISINLCGAFPTMRTCTTHTSHPSLNAIGMILM